MLTITVTPVSDEDPCPRVEIEVTGITGADTITVERIVNLDVTNVRGALNAPVSTGFLSVDYEAPFNTDIAYRVTTSLAGNTVETFTSPTVTVLSWLFGESMAWVHDPLRPDTARTVSFEGSAFGEYAYSREQNLLPIRGASLPIASGGTMSGATVPLTLITHTDDETVALHELLQSASPFLVRTDTLDALTPRLMYAAISDLRVVPLDLAGGPNEKWSLFQMTVTQVRAPAASVVVPVFTWQDVIDNYTSWDDLIATKATWADVIRDPRP